MAGNRRGESTLIFAPTGTGKTLAAFLWCINRIMSTPVSGGRMRYPEEEIKNIITWATLNHALNYFPLERSFK